MLELRTLGTVDLKADGRTLFSVLSQPTRLALLTYLAVARPRGSHRREALMHLLWPGRDEGRARKALRQTLHRLRRSVGEEVVSGTGEQNLALGPDTLWCDAIAFEVALREGDPEEALKLYGGPFLKGFHLRDSAEFERWVDRERDRLARRAHEAAWSLATGADERGEAAEATRWARRAVALKPYEERGWRRLISLLDRYGERAGAVRAYEELAERLKQELGIEPSPETRAAAERVRSRRTAGRETGEASEEKIPGASADRASAQPPEPEELSEALVKEPKVGAGRGRPAVAAGEGVGAVEDRGHRPRGGSAARIGAWAGALGLGAAAAVAAVGLPWLSDGAGGVTASAGPEPTPERTVAVLPFVDISPEPGHEYFSYGLTEEVIAVLARVDGVRVVARTSAFAFGGEDRDIREIGRALNVTAVVEGSVRKEENRIRVAAQLIDASDGFHLWSEIYDRRLTDVFELQEEIALRIAEALRPRLTRDERARLARQRTEYLEAYTDYLKGRYFWNRRTLGGLTRAIDYFERAIEADPGFAPAHAGLAAVFAPAGGLGYLHPGGARERMGTALRRALELDDGLVEAHTALGAYRLAYERDWKGAERAFRRAIELDPEHATARQWYAFLLRGLGRYDEAIAQLTEAVGLEPLSPILYVSLGAAHRLAGEFDAALEHLRAALELDPGFWLAHEGAGKVYERRGELGEAVPAFERSVAHAGPTPRPKAGLARALALSGRAGEARRILEELVAQGAESDRYYPDVATVFEALGDPDAAFEWLERSYAQRHPRLSQIGTDTSFDRLREHPRFQELLGRMGLR